MEMSSEEWKVVEISTIRDRKIINEILARSGICYLQSTIFAIKPYKRLPIRKRKVCSVSDRRGARWYTCKRKADIVLVFKSVSNKFYSRYICEKCLVKYFEDSISSFEYLFKRIMYNLITITREK
jgi:hypothetical protein